jgi:ABC-type nitrate/sulfonate/bicarbonate transport system permease component
VDAVARDTARSFGLSRGSRVVNLVFPTALPYLMTGLRLARSVALILAITAEMFIGNPGSGARSSSRRSAGNWPACTRS